MTKKLSMLMLYAGLVSLMVANVLICGAPLPEASADEYKSEFRQTKIDIGVVVSDLEKSVAFYTEAIGFTKLMTFDVPADFATAAGLTDNQSVHVQVLVLGEGASATWLKLMEIPDVESKESENETIHSQLGYSYLTVHVASMPTAIARLEKAGTAPIADGPVALPEGLPQGISLAVIRDPDGNLIELVGPSE